MLIGLKSGLDVLNQQIEELESFADKDNRKLGSFMEREQSRRELSLRALQDRRQDLEREIVMHENDVMSEEEDMRILKSVLDERLGLQ